MGLSRSGLPWKTPLAKILDLATKTDKELQELYEWTLDTEDVFLRELVVVEKHRRIAIFTFSGDIANRYIGQGTLCPYCGRRYLRKEQEPDGGLADFRYIHADFGDDAVMCHSDTEQRKFEMEDANASL